jgi:hypothetical protein
MTCQPSYALCKKQLLRQETVAEINVKSLLLQNNGTIQILAVVGLENRDYGHRGSAALTM